MRRARIQKKIIAIFAILTLLILPLVACNTNQPAATDSGAHGATAADTPGAGTSAQGGTSTGAAASADAPSDPQTYNGAYYGLGRTGMYTLIVSNYSDQGFNFIFVECNEMGYAGFTDVGQASWDDGTGHGISFSLTNDGIHVEGGNKHPGVDGDYSKDKPTVDPNSSAQNGAYTATFSDGTTETLMISDYTFDGFHFEFVDSGVSGDATFSDDGNAYYMADSYQHTTFRFVYYSVIVLTGFDPSLSATYFQDFQD